MTEEKSTAYLYLFPDDGTATDERIAEAASRYFARKGAPLPPQCFSVERTQRGKPVLSGHPGVYLSVSHSGRWLICAFADFQVGIDLQRHETDSGEGRAEAEAGFSKKAERFFHKNEADFVAEAPFSRFFTVWTAKESFVKLTGSGIDGGFSTFSVVPEEKAEWGRIAERGPVLWQRAGVYFCKAEKDEYTFCAAADRKFNIMLENTV